MRTIELKRNAVVIVDQTKLPTKLKFIECKNAEDVARAIERMQIRGAPALGVAAVMALALTALKSKAKDKTILLQELEQTAARIRKTRPTGANLFIALNRVLKAAMLASGEIEVREAVVREVERMVEEDNKANRLMGEHGASLIKDGDVVLTHCNAGWLATAGDYGTALATVRVARELGKRVSVIATETRPLLQGARLTAWELTRNGIPTTVITDNMVGYCLSKKLADLVMVGADRVLADGHAANKIGTYTIAIVARHHKIPFYVVAPSSSFDLESNVEDVVIEERSTSEVMEIAGRRIIPTEARVLNPAFDITPPDLITAIITEKGVIRPPYKKNILKVIKKC